VSNEAVYSQTARRYVYGRISAWLVSHSHTVQKFLENWNIENKFLNPDSMTQKYSIQWNDLEIRTNQIRAPIENLRFRFPTRLPKHTKDITKSGNRKVKEKESAGFTFCRTCLILYRNMKVLCFRVSPLLSFKPERRCNEGFHAQLALRGL
jgi:hypothetical protein